MIFRYLNATSHSSGTERLCSVAVYAKRYRNRTGLSYHYTHSHLAEEDRAGERSSVAPRSLSAQQTDRHKRKKKKSNCNIIVYHNVWFHQTNHHLPLHTICMSVLLDCATPADCLYWKEMLYTKVGTEFFVIF